MQSKQEMIDTITRKCSSLSQRSLQKVNKYCAEMVIVDKTQKEVRRKFRDEIYE